MLKPKHTLQSLVKELVTGLECGAITLESENAPGAKVQPPPIPEAKPTSQQTMPASSHRRGAPTP
jgi:hypothetical protein